MTATEFERCRLAALERYCILDTNTEENFDAIARLAGNVCCAPVALISIVDRQRQWFKSRIDIDLEETSRDISFCSQAIEAAGELFVIEDARDDARFNANPLVAGPPYVRFYAGMPFRSSDGFALGTLCVIDFVPRTLSTRQSEALRTLGKQVEAQLELRQNSKALAERQKYLAQYQLVFESTPDVVLFARREDARILEVNEAAAAMYGYTRAEIAGMTLHDFHRRGTLSDLRLRLPHGCPQGIAFRTIHCRKDGSSFPVDVTTRAARLQGEEIVFALVRDVSDRVRNDWALVSHTFELKASNTLLANQVAERKDAETRLRHATFHDSLTGLPNRALFCDRLQHTIAQQQRRNDRFTAILLLDIDRFKVFNDSLGRAAGDFLLVSIARRLEGCLGPADTLARLGGDEFVILLEDVTDERAPTRVAERILSEFKAPFLDAGHDDMYASASIGVVVTSTGFDLADDILRAAEIAMYRAKDLGRQRYQVYVPEYLTRAASLLPFERDLNRALERREFCLMYQPIVSLQDEGLTGFEALIRWQHPERGLVPPDDFIRAAEETGAIVAIGDWVLNQACRQARIWQEAFAFESPLAMNVNVSAKQFSDPGFLSRVQRVLSKETPSVGTLQLEITETALMTDLDASVALLTTLRTNGIPVHLDDFGTGYSSLGYLHRFPVHTLKIDRSFVSGAGGGLANPQIVEAVIVLATKLGLGTVAEGIETKEQLYGLRALGCSHGQGYYFSRPLSAAAATDMIGKRFDVIARHALQDGS
jgi:diguanylate cyclase (GGDEF)-like protein/PAS domain S-box-containing protein